MNRKGSERALGVALIVVLCLSTLGEGGSAAASLLGWHALVVALAAWALLVLSPSRCAWPADFTVALAAFLAWFFVGWMRAPNRYGALLTTIELAFTLAIGWFAWRAGSRGLDGMERPLLAAGAVHGIWIAGQWLTGDDPRPAGTFLNPNHAALWLVAVLALAVGTSLASEGKRSKSMLALGALAFAGVLATGSRGALLALGGGGIALLWSLWPRLAARAKKVLIAGLLAVLAAAAIPVALRLWDGDFFRWHRTKIWRASLDVFVSSPWWGSGPGGFAAAAERFRFPDGEAPLRFDKIHTTTHSDPIRLLAELGAPATVCLLLAVAFTWRRVRRARSEGRLAPLACGGVGALAAIAVQSFVDNPSSTSALYVLTAAIWGVVLAATSLETVRERRGRPPVFGFTARAVCAVTLVTIFVVADVGPYLAWRATSTLGRGPLDAERKARLERAMRLNPLHAGYPALLAEAVARAPLTIESHAAGREAAERAVRLDPTDYASWLALARLQAATCRTRLRNVACREMGRASFLAAERRAPYRASIPTEAAIFLLDLGAPEEAVAAAERALALEPEAVLPRIVLADALLDEGGEQARHEAERVLDEAEAKARAWAGRDALLRLDPEQFSRVRRRLAEERGFETETAGR